MSPHRRLFESKEDKILRILENITHTQEAVVERIAGIEAEVREINLNVRDLRHDVDQLSKSSKIIRRETDGIVQRTKLIKQYSINIAAHTLNTARKIHGATSVLDPVKQFTENEGYKDWVIRPDRTVVPHAVPAPSHTQVASSSAMANQFQRSKPEFPMHGDRNPVHVNLAPVRLGNEETVSRSPNEDHSQAKGSSTLHYDAFQERERRSPLQERTQCRIETPQQATFQSSHIDRNPYRKDRTYSRGGPQEPERRSSHQGQSPAGSNTIPKYETFQEPSIDRNPYRKNATSSNPGNQKLTTPVQPEKSSKDHTNSREKSGPSSSINKERIKSSIKIEPAERQDHSNEFNIQRTPVNQIQDSSDDDANYIPESLRTPLYEENQEECESNSRSNAKAERCSYINRLGPSSSHRFEPYEPRRSQRHSNEDDNEEDIKNVLLSKGNEAASYFENHRYSIKELQNTIFKP